MCGVADRGDATRLLLDAVETSSGNDAILEVDSDHSRVDEPSNGGRKAVIVSDLVRELSTRRETFRTMGRTQRPQARQGCEGNPLPAGRRRHLRLRGDEARGGSRPEPGSWSEQALNLRASWVATEIESTRVHSSPARVRSSSRPEPIRRSHRRPRGALITTSVRTAKLVGAGLGVTLVPALAAQAVRADVAFPSRPADAPPRTVYAATLHGVTPSPQ